MEELNLTGKTAVVLGIANRWSIAYAIANTLQAAGIIRYRRGKIEIVDYERLKQSACECFFIIKNEFEVFRADEKFPIMSGNGQM